MELLRGNDTLFREATVKIVLDFLVKRVYSKGKEVATLRWQLSKLRFISLLKGSTLKGKKLVPWEQLLSV